MPAIKVVFFDTYYVIGLANFFTINLILLS